MPTQALSSNSKSSISGSLSVINRFRQFGSLIRPLRRTFVYATPAFDKLGKPFGVRLELVGKSKHS